MREELSPAERQFERLRRTAGLFLGPLVFALLLIFPASGLSVEAARLAAVVGLVVVWWITEAVPIPVTAVLGPALAVLLGVSGAREMFAPFGDPILFLFLGGFLLAEGMTRHGLDRRIAYALLGSRLVGGRPFRVLAAFAVLAAGTSMWISNTAATAMLYPIALGVFGALAGAAGGANSRFAAGLLLACAYGASIGGIATPVGTPPNLIAMGQLAELAGTRITFLEWMLLAGPVSTGMLILAVAYLRLRFPPPAREIEGAGERIAEERATLGPLARGEKNVLAAFSVAVTLWVLPGVVSLALGSEAPASRQLAAILPEGIVAVLAAGLLFLLPVQWRERRFTLTWEDAIRIDWGTLLLFGGGLALGAAMFRTGLAARVGDGLTALTGADSTVALTFAFGIFAIWFTEVTSNTATATMLVPLAVAAGQASGADPVPPALACALGCSMAFMLPVATPPNAIVYGSGRLRVTQMVSAGFWMNLVASGIVPVGVLVMWRILGR